MVADLVTLMERASRGLGWEHHYRNDPERTEWRSEHRLARKERHRIDEPEPSKAEKIRIENRIAARKLEQSEEYQREKRRKQEKIQRERWEKNHREGLCKMAIDNFVREHGMPPPDFYERLVARARKYFGLT